MNIFVIRFMLAAATCALLTACGGATDPAADQASLAAPMATLNAPVADCEAEGCNRPRVVDGLAEQFRASVIAEPPAEPVQTGKPVLLGDPAVAPSETAPGAGVT